MFYLSKKFFARTAFLAGALLSLSTSAIAGELADSYRRTYARALDAMLKLDLAKLGVGQNGDLVRINSRLYNAVNFVEVSSFKKPSGATRFTAFNNCRTNSVYINRDQPHKVTTGIVLHEALGALCVQDRNYQFSSLLAIAVNEISGSKARVAIEDRSLFWSGLMSALGGGTRIRSSLVETLASQARINASNEVAEIAGSGTIIGEAGDAIAQDIKSRVILRQLARKTEDYDAEKRFVGRDRRLRYNMLLTVVNQIVVERVSARKITYKVVKSKESKWKNRYYFYVPTSMGSAAAAEEIFRLINRLL